MAPVVGAFVLALLRMQAEVTFTVTICHTHTRPSFPLRYSVSVKITVAHTQVTTCTTGTKVLQTDDASFVFGNNVGAMPTLVWKREVANVTDTLCLVSEIILPHVLPYVLGNAQFLLFTGVIRGVRRTRGRTGR